MPFAPWAIEQMVNRAKETLEQMAIEQMELEQMAIKQMELEQMS